MGTASCRNICGEKSEYELINQNINSTKINYNTLLNNNDSINLKNYNNFQQRFESKLPFIGKYFDTNDFKQMIPEEANNYMIQNVLNIPDKISFNKYIYEMKPIQFENGNIYSGNWNDNFKMDGLGQYFIQQGNIFIDGIWNEGKLVYGRIFYSNGNIYEGDIKNSTYHGKGKLIFNTNEKYEGDFANGEITGYGIFTFKDGTKYEGKFNKGEFKGHGKINWINGIQYEGDFSGAILSGFGKLIGDNGDKYEGSFNNNYFNGKGIYTYKDGSVYEGEFEFGLMNGKGVYKKKDEFIFDGEWDYNLPNGFGKFTNSNFVIKGVWRNGNNVEISEFEKGDKNNFNKDILNFEVKPFSLIPHMLPNLENVKNDEKKFQVETTPSYLNTFE